MVSDAISRLYGHILTHAPGDTALQKIYVRAAWLRELKRSSARDNLASPIILDTQ
jgi:hypothetical protein